MRTFLRLFIVAAAGAFVTGAVADTPPCKDCDPQVKDSPISHREQLRAARAKYDRENEKVIARPWDAIKNDKPSPEKDK